jgi:hypothetical protein
MSDIIIVKAETDIEYTCSIDCIRTGPHNCNHYDRRTDVCGSDDCGLRDYV